MADLTEAQSSQAVKIAGANPGTGIEDNYAEVAPSGALVISATDGYKATYSAAVVGLSAAVLATDIFTIIGSSTKTIRINRIEVSGTTTSGSGASVNLQLIKRSTANTGGTTSTLTIVPHDSSDSAASASVVAYTANPSSLGTSLGVIRSNRTTFATAGIAQQPIIWGFGEHSGKSIILRGTSQLLSINLGAVSVTGSIIDINIEWVEE